MHDVYFILADLIEVCIPNGSVFTISVMISSLLLFSLPPRITFDVELNLCDADKRGWLECYIYFFPAIVTYISYITICKDLVL